MLFLELRQLLLCGGSGGHMAHPFDVQGVTTGTDLVNVFRKAAHSLVTNPGSVKFDGINIAMRVVRGADGKLQFALDRGSSKALDVAGITVDKLQERFPSGANGAEHGMAVMGKRVLGALNKHIDSLMPEVKKLGIVSDSGTMPVKILNAEYVSGLTNTVDYSRMKNPEFIALHNVLLSDWKDPVKKKARQTAETQFSLEDLQALAKKMDGVLSKEFGGKFRVYGPQTTITGKGLEKKLRSAIDAALERPFTIKYSADRSETKKLSEWLANSTNPRERMQKTPYINTLKGEALDTVVSDPNNKDEVKGVIDSTVFYHATRDIGKAMLAVIDLQNKADFGAIVDQTGFQGHEGVVINDPSISDRPFKITGDFLVANVDMSKFKKETDRGGSGSAWVFFVGSFKPPTRAHFEAIQKNVQRIKGSGRMVVIIGQPKKEENIRSKTIDANAAKKVFELYARKYGLGGKLAIVTVDELQAIEKQNARPDIKRKVSMAQFASPVMALKFYLEAYVDPNDTVYAIKGQKDIDDQRFAFLEKERAGFTVIVQPNVLVRHVRGTVPVSATELREAIDSGNRDAIQELIPDKVTVDEFLSALGASSAALTVPAKNTDKGIKGEAFRQAYRMIVVEGRMR